MPGIPEIGAELVETALTFAPWLEEVPVLGRILRVIAPGGGNDIHAAEQLAAELQKRKTDRETRIQRNARYVLKASDAMQCVDDSVADTGVLLAFGKSLLNIVRGRPDSTPDILENKIFQCIESKVLKQTGKRKKKVKKYYGRPAVGHGKGRVKIPVEQSP